MPGCVELNMKNDKKILIFILISLMTSICFLTSNVYAATVSSPQEQANSILNNTLGINSDLYSKVNLKENTETNNLLHIVKLIIF